MCSLMKDSYINIKEIAEAKGLKSTRSLRLEINKPESKYISREVKVNGGSSYEILFSSLEPELQQKLREAENKSTELVPLNYKSETLVTDKSKFTRNHRMNIVKAALEKRKNYKTIKESDSDFLDLYNTGLFLPKAYNFLGSISIGTLRRWIQAYRKQENADCLIPKYKSTRQGEYNTILDLRRDIQNYKEAWAFRADNEEFVGKVTAVRAVAALHAETVSKDEFKEAMSIKKRNLKITKSYIKQTREISLEEKCENYKTAYASVEKACKPKVSKIANTNMDKAIRKNKEMEAFGRQDLSMFLEEKVVKEEPLYLFETDKILEEERKASLKGVANGY